MDSWKAPLEGVPSSILNSLNHQLQLEGILQLVKGILKEKPEIRAILLDPWARWGPAGLVVPRYLN